MSENKIIRVTDLSNEEFLKAYAAPGRIGLSGGSTWIDRAIRAAERRLDEQNRWSQFSHVFVFQGKRQDGHHWIMESDLQFVGKHINLGVQENRASKYHDEILYHTLAILDFELPDHHRDTILTKGLDLIANKTRYSIRELVGTWFALLHPEDRSKENRLSREHSLYCSAFVQHLFRHIQVEFAPGVTDKNTTPEDIFRCPIPHKTYLLERPRERTRLANAAIKIKEKIQERKSRKQKPATG